MKLTGENRSTQGKNLSQCHFVHRKSHMFNCLSRIYSCLSFTFIWLIINQDPSTSLEAKKPAKELKKKKDDIKILKLNLSNHFQFQHRNGVSIFMNKKINTTLTHS
jgi:hypothetical protein